MSKIIYSGTKFREFLSRRGITYQEASNYLGIDKNTISKVIRGGNLSLNVLLTICNMYHLSISDFFSIEYDDDDPQTRENEISLALAENRPSSKQTSDPESVEKYISSKKTLFQYENYIASKDQEIDLLRELNQLYKQQINLLQEKVLESSYKEIL